MHPKRNLKVVTTADSGKEGSRLPSVRSAKASGKLGLASTPTSRTQTEKPQLRLLSKLAAGTHCVMYKGELQGTPVAVKFAAKQDKHTNCELLVCARLQTVGTYSSHVIATLPPVPSPDSKHIFLPMELADQDLLAHTDALGGLEECEASLLFLQVARGLRHLHGAGIYHLDVKPENVLMVGGLAKVSDFGTAHVMDKSESASQPGASPKRLASSCLTTKPCGTAIYACPEGVARAASASTSAPTTPSPVIRSIRRSKVGATETASPSAASRAYIDAEKADVWSLGVSLFVTVIGAFPWRSAGSGDRRFARWEEAHAIGSAATATTFTRVFGIAATQHGTPLTFAFMDLLWNMLHPDASKRLPMRAVENHPFFSGVVTPTHPRTTSSLKDNTSPPPAFHLGF
jgi:serine/threonine protein kinase